MTKQIIVGYRPENYSTSHRTFVVLGAPRGGTSMVAGSLQILGVPMGSVNRQHEDPIFHDENNIGRMIETIGVRNSIHLCWGWKLPNTIHYYQKLAPYIRNPVFIVVYRNPFDIFMSASSKAGEGLHDRHFNAPAYHYARMHRLIDEEGYVPAYVLSYDAAVRAPKRFVRELADLLPTSPEQAAIGRCVDFISPSRGYSRISP